MRVKGIRMQTLKIFLITFLVSSLFNLTFATSYSKKKFITFMNYNVENLFDTVHDPGKEDYTYLPKRVKDASPEIQAYCRSINHSYYQKECFEKDWNEEILAKKIVNISKVIRSFNHGKGPDILVLQEVENMNVLKMLRDYGLSGMGYRSLVLLEGPDKRGIDVAMLSRFPVTEQKLHELDLYDHEGRIITRGILQATFNIYGNRVTVFGNHWPSQGKPDHVRYQVAEQFKDIAKNIQNSIIISTGDFNTLEDDNPHGLNSYVLNTDLDHFFHDSQQVTETYCEDNRLYNYPLAGGTHWYRGEWSYLDKILISDRIRYSHHFAPVWCAFDVHKPAFALREKRWHDYDTGEVTIYNIPRRFDDETGEGYSDHLPVTMVFEVQ